ncbi:MAG: hypothetical protein ACKVU1_00415 [bacterium]
MRRRRGARRVDPQRRAQILSTASRLGLTANEVERRFGVSKWTFYAWRKDPKRGRGRVAGAKKARARGVQPDASPGGTRGAPARDVGAELRAILPRLIAQELARAFAAILKGGPPAGKRQRGERVRRARTRRRRPLR